MKRSERAFVVGRKTRKATTVVVLNREPHRGPRPRMEGPWTLRAVVTPVRGS